MRKLNYKDFYKEIDKKNISTAYLFVGEEYYLMEMAIERVKDAFIAEGMEDLNYSVFDRKDLDFDDLYNACETLPFMNDKKIILVKDIGEVIESSKDFDGDLGAYIEKVNPTSSLILIDKLNLLKKTSKTYKAIKKQEGLIEFPRLKAKDLENWILASFKKLEKSISIAEVNYLISQSKYGVYGSDKNLYELENEINKIGNFALGQEITKTDVDKVLSKSLDTNIFNLLGAINRRDRDESLRILNDMYEGNEPIQKIVFMIIRQVKLMLGFRLYKNRGDNDTSIQKKLQIKDYEFRKISKDSMNLSEESLTKAMDYLLDFDIKQKTRSIDEKIGLEKLIIYLQTLK